MVVVAVDVDDEAVEVEVAEDAICAEAEGPCVVVDAIYPGLVPCWGRAPTEDDPLEGEEDEGGEGKRDALPLDEV